MTSEYFSRKILDKFWGKELEVETLFLHKPTALLILGFDRLFFLVWVMSVAPFMVVELPVGIRGVWGIELWEFLGVGDRVWMPISIFLISLSRI